MKNSFSSLHSHLGSVCTAIYCAAAFISFQATLLAREDFIQKEFKVQPGGSLTMKVDRGNIKIVTADTTDASIEVRREVKRGPDELLDQHKVEISQRGNDLLVTAENVNRQRGWSFFKGEQFHVSYLVKIPRKFNVNTRTSGGTIRIADLQGKAECRTAGGNIDLGAIGGPVFAQTSGGSITLENATGGAELVTAGGNIKVTSAEGDLTARTSGGSIHAQKVNGKSLLQTSGGNIRIDEASGMIQASTSGGSITAQLNKTPTGETSLKTSGGNVTLALPANVAASVDARTSGGEVRTTFPDTNRKNRSRLQTDLNGGGARISLETSGGSVNLNKI